MRNTTVSVAGRAARLVAATRALLAVVVRFTVLFPLALALLIAMRLWPVTLVLLSIVLIETFDLTAGAFLGTVVLAAVVLFAGFVIAANVKEILDDAAKIRRVRRSQSAYVLLLAAFSRSLDDEGFVGQFRVGSSTERHIPREKFEVELRPVEEALLRDIELPVIRIGGKRDDAVLRLKVADRFWYNAFQEMSIGATAILVVPGIGKSLLRELAAICGRQDLRDKTLLIQPGGFELSEKHLERIGLPIDAPVESWPRSKRQEHWQPIVQRVRETTGVELPRWNVDGQIVSLADPEHRAPCTSEGLKTLLADIGPGLSLDAGLTRVRLMIRNKERGVQ